MCGKNIYKNCFDRNNKKKSLICDFPKIYFFFFFEQCRSTFISNAFHII